jgi:hypothetical protein
MIFLSEPPLHEETMVSWAWRVFNEVDCPTEWIALHQAFYVSHGCDPDFNFLSPFALELQRITQLTASDLRERFSVGGALVIPRKARSAYCYECLEDSVRQVGLPSWKRSWCSPFIPICQKHQHVLSDTLNRDASYYEFPALAFIEGAESSYSANGGRLSNYSKRWYGERYMEPAVKSQHWYCNFLSSGTESWRFSLRRLWEIIFIALMGCHVARLGTWKGWWAGETGPGRSTAREKRSATGSLLKEGLYGSISTRMEALFYCGMVFGVFRFMSSEDDVFGYAPMDPLVLGRRMRRDKPEISLWLVGYMERRHALLLPATKQFLEGLKLSSGSYDHRFKW